MPNTPFYGYNDPNLLSVYLEIKNKVIDLEKKIRDLEQKLSNIENKNNNQSFEYQTSMNMM